MTNKLKPTDPYAAAGVNIEAGNTFVDSIKAFPISISTPAAA